MFVKHCTALCFTRVIDRPTSQVPARCYTVLSHMQKYMALKMLRQRHGDGCGRQMPEMRVIPSRRGVAIHDKHVLLLFDLRLHVGRRCGKHRAHSGRLAGRSE